MKLIMMMGISGSGKSTYAKSILDDLKNETSIIINRDTLRTMVFGEYNYKAHVEFAIMEIAIKSMNIAFDYGFDVIMDETNLTTKRRNVWIEAVREYNLNGGEKVCIEVVHTTENCKNLEYRMCDDRGISREKWADVINGQKKYFEPINDIERKYYTSVEKIEHV